MAVQYFLNSFFLLILELLLIALVLLNAYGFCACERAHPSVRSLHFGAATHGGTVPWSNRVDQIGTGRFKCNKGLWLRHPWPLACGAEVSGGGSGARGCGGHLMFQVLTPCWGHLSCFEVIRRRKKLVRAMKSSDMSYHRRRTDAFMCP